VCATSRSGVIQFAQALATGKSVTEAYALAGFKKDKGNASRLAANKSVAARVRELKETIAEKVIMTQAEVSCEQ
jgi:phage terminase small subunit